MFSELILSVAVLSTLSVTAPLQNETVLVPPGTTNHGNPKLLCTPTTWYKTLIFLVTNYFAHAATVNQFPGEKLYPYLFAIFTSLMYPYVGVIRGLEPIFRHARFEKHPLKMATQAGALCVVVRDENWAPVVGEQMINDVSVRNHPPKAHSTPGEAGAEELQMLAHAADSEGSLKRASIKVDYVNFEIWGVQLPTPSEDAKVHGIRTVPKGYVLRVLPSNAVVVPNTDREPKEIEVTSSSNLSKSFVALVQLISGSTTLYRTRGDEITRYGYAAFGLTVIPYMVMSLINLTGSFLTPHYESLYLVSSPELEEARLRGGVFDGTVGKIVPLDRPLDGSRKAAVFRVNDSETMVIAEILPDQTLQEPRTADEGQQNTSDRQASGSSEDLFFEIVPSGSKKEAQVVIPRCTPYQTAGPSRWGSGSYLFLIGCLLQAIPYAVIGGLSRFHKGQSTRHQRIWTMLWLNFGVILGWATSLLNHYAHDNMGAYMILLFLAAPAFGGYVVVCQMLKSYGYCVEVGEAF